MSKFLVVGRSIIATAMVVSLVACGSAPTANNPSPETPASPLGLSNNSASPSPSPSPSPSATAKAAVPPAPEPDPTPETPAALAPETPVATEKLAANSSSQTQEITVYQLDNECMDFVAKKVTVPTQNAANTLVGKVLETSNSPDFKIENYRVQVENGTATIDLRLPPEAKRPFTAMSACEQQSLLGSLSKTLTSNPNLKINTVRFTDGKEELVF
jgi:type IV secretory pathway VirB10-like protein